MLKFMVAAGQRGHLEDSINVGKVNSRLPLLTSTKWTLSSVWQGFA